jgi:hypothetical protein
MEKHTIQDGPIPLSGLSPLVVCRQWGRNYSDTMIGFPIAFSVPPIIIGCHWGTNADVNTITKNDLVNQRNITPIFTIQITMGQY